MQLPFAVHPDYRFNSPEAGGLQGPVDRKTVRLVVFTVKLEWRTSDATRIGRHNGADVRDVLVIVGCNFFDIFIS